MGYNSYLVGRIEIDPPAQVERVQIGGIPRLEAARALRMSEQRRK